MDLSVNINTHWSSIFVDALAAAGLRSVCIAPGSRSTPLALAFARHPEIRLYEHLDERSAGFFALGMAMRGQQNSSHPVALVCTSGTAAANFHPAVIEAYYSHIPLLVLTADRPPELRESGANQTIDQVKMFGDHVLWSVDAPVPHQDAPELVTRHLRTLAARACAIAGGLVKGPVHINFPFRKPLEPSQAVVQPDRSPEPPSSAGFGHQTRINHGRLYPTSYQVSELADVVIQNKRGIIICGPALPDASFETAVIRLAKRSGYPILADPLSSLRFSHAPDAGMVLTGYHTWLPAIRKDFPRADVIIRFGAIPTSSSLTEYLDRITPTASIHIREDGAWADDLHRTQTMLQVDAEIVCHSLANELEARGFAPDLKWSAWLQELEKQMWAILDETIAVTPFFDGKAISQTLDGLPEDTALFAGNSLPIRHLDTFGRKRPKMIDVFGNRGASGIDGNVSTSLGIAAAGHQPVLALLGDITFYHDMNGLLATRFHNLHDVTFVVINNNGGGIFHRLPVSDLEPPFTDLFLMPHGLGFEHAAAMYGLGYRQVASQEELSEALRWAFHSSEPRTAAKLIEVRTDSRSDFKIHRAMIMDVQAKLKAVSQTLLSENYTPVV